MYGVGEVVFGHTSRVEDLGEVPATVLDAGPVPDLLLGGGQGGTDLLDAVGGHQAGRDAPPRAAIRGLPWGQGATPVEDHRINRHA
jgi:hypothetical protein